MFDTNPSRIFVIAAVGVAACDTAPPEPAEHGSELRGSVVTPALAEPDQDCDSIPDEWEDKIGLDPADPSDGDDDMDGDGVPTSIETRLGWEPNEPDSDGDGIPDDEELAAMLDLDGDGLPTPDDVCPRDGDPGQEDRDGDGVGDACDPSPTGGDEAQEVELVTILEAYDASAGDWALRPAMNGDLDRLTTDRAGLLSMPSSFRLLDAPFPGVVSLALHELYHPVNRDHAYRTTLPGGPPIDLEGYEDLGVIGYLGESELPFGEPVTVRRFRRASDGHEAITVDDTQAARLLDEGYADLGKIGFGLVDHGRVRPRVPVVRIHAPDSWDRTRHLEQPTDAPDDVSDGPRFGVWPERFGDALPLYRLRDPAGVELLSTDEHEVGSLLDSGHTLDGILGWVSPDEAHVPVVVKAELLRLDGAGQTRVTADEQEIAGLLDEGFTIGASLGYVAVVPRVGCVAPDPVLRLEEKLVALADPDARAVTTLLGLASMCTITNLLDGTPAVTPYETEVAASLPADPETRRLLRAHAQSWLDLGPGTRAVALGELASLDPGSCDTPIDLDELGKAVAAILFEFVGPPPSLRQDFCDGTTYSVGDPEHGTPREARAVTADAGDGLEISANNGARPRLDGLIDTTSVRGHSVLEAAATNDPDVGYPLTGVQAGFLCTSDAQCPASQGLKCVTGECMAYPIVTNSSRQTVVGVNMWDVIDGQVLLRDTVSGALHRLVATVVSGEPEDAARCDMYGPRNHATVDLQGLTPGRFFEIVYVNRNGNFYEHDETIPSDRDAARAGGRTIHVCWDPADPALPPDTITDCEPVVTPSGNCINDGPSCDATVGGVWGGDAGELPRSLSACTQPGVNCGETPREFSSATSQPQLVFVEAEPPARTVVVTVEGLTCYDESSFTNWFGSDEVVLTAQGFTGGLPARSFPFARDMDFPTRRRGIGHELLTLQLREGADMIGGGVGSFSFDMIEDDDDTWSLVGGAATGLAVGFAKSAAWGGVAGAAALAGIHFLYAGDDNLGSWGVTASVADVTDRGAMCHDPLLTPVPSLTSEGPSQDVLAIEASVHPAVDNSQYSSNSLVLPCSSNADCVPSMSCTMGACVALGWVDRVPGENGQPPGFLERIRMDGSSSDYELYLGWHTR